jgi:hypothetical protein
MPEVRGSTPAGGKTGREHGVREAGRAASERQGQDRMRSSPNLLDRGHRARTGHSESEVCTGPVVRLDKEDILKMAELSELTEIKVGIARIEEQLKAQANIIAQLAPASEVTSLRRDVADVENDLKDLRDGVPTCKDHDDLKSRVGKLESNQSWVIRIIIGAVIVGILGLLGLKAHTG